MSETPSDLGGDEDNFASAFSAAHAADAAGTPAAATPQLAANPAAQPEFTPEQYRELQARLEQLEPVARYGQSLAPYMSDIAKFLAERERPPPVEPEPEVEQFDPGAYFKEAWDVPEITPQMQFAIDNGMVEMDATGKYIPVPGMESMAMPVLAGLNQAHLSHRQQVAGLFKGNFPEKVYGMIEKPLLHKIEQMLGERFGKYQSQQQQERQIQEFRQSHEALLYAKDPKTGATSFTAQGQAFADAMRTLEDAGVKDQAMLLKLAGQMAGLNAQSAGVVGARPNGRDGSAPSPAPTPAAAVDPRQSFIDRAMAATQHSPAAAGYAPAAPAHATVDHGELRSMFSTALRQSQA